MPLENARGVIFFCHGNDGNVSTRLGTIRHFRSLGFSTLIYDYGGFGRSTGRPSEKRVHADTRAMWDHLVQARGLSPGRIVIWGRSFGGGAACELARRVVPAAVVLESTFTSMADAAFAAYPWFPAQWFLRHRFANEDKVADIKAPLLVIHSRQDTLYPFAHGVALFERATEPKQLLELDGDHGEGPTVSKQVYFEGLAGFLDPLLPRTASPGGLAP